MWTPSSEFSIQVSDKEKQLYADDDPSCQFYKQRWLYRKGRHKGGEFPVVVVRKHLIDNGYRVWVSGVSKLGMAAYILAMFPTARRERDQSYLNTVHIFGEELTKEFITIVETHKKDAGTPRHGGDPDLLAQDSKDPANRFFVEVKAEDLTGKSKYKDKLNNQQLFVFPLIEKHLGCQVRVATVQIVPETVP